MKLFLVLLTLPATAFGFSPEALLSAPATISAEGPGARQHWNPFSRVQAGYEYGDLGSEKHEFSLQLRPKSISEGSRYKAYAQALREDAKVSAEILRSRELALGYTLVVDTALAKEQTILVKEWKQLLEQSQGLSALEARRSGADVKSLIKNGPEVDKAQNELIDLEALIAATESQLARRNLKLADLETNDLAGPRDIADRLNKISQGASLSRAKLETKLAVEQGAFTHAVAASNHLLDAIKVTAQTESQKKPSFGVELTFNLPFLAAEDLGEVKDRLKLAELEVETREKIREESLRTAGLSKQIRGKIDLLESLEKRISGSSSAASVARQDPSLAFELKRAYLKNRLLAAELRAEIRILFVQLLLEEGRLAAEPGLNHLSKSGRRI